MKLKAGIHCGTTLMLLAFKLSMCNPSKPKCHRWGDSRVNTTEKFRLRRHRVFAETKSQERPAASAPSKPLVLNRVWHVESGQKCMLFVLVESEIGVGRVRKIRAASDTGPKQCAVACFHQSILLGDSAQD